MAIPFAYGDYLITMSINGDETLANSIKQSTQERGENKEQREREDPSPSQKKQNPNWVTLIVV